MKTISKNTEFFSTSELNNFVRLYEKSTNDLEILALGGARAELNKRGGEVEYAQVLLDNERLQKELAGATNEIIDLESEIDDLEGDLNKAEDRVEELKESLRIILDEVKRCSARNGDTFILLDYIQQICLDDLKKK